MSGLTELSKTVSAAFGKKKNARLMRIGQLGNGNNVVETGNPNMVYVRISGRVGEIYNNRIAPKNDKWVIVGFEDGSNLEQVLGSFNDRETYGEINKTTYDTPIDVSSMRYPGAKTLYIEQEQFLPLLVIPTDPPSMSVTLVRGTLKFSAGAVVVETQTVNFSSIGMEFGYAKFVNIEIDSNGNVYQNEGEAVDFSSLDYKTDIPTVSSGNFLIASVRIYSGQGAILKSSIQNDIIDLRFGNIGVTATRTYDLTEPIRRGMYL